MKGLLIENKKIFMFPNVIWIGFLREKPTLQSSTISMKGEEMMKEVKTPKNYVVMSNFNKKLFLFQDKCITKIYALIE